ncbi:MAG TPA: ABC transporter ATP-binding protein [Euzebyales bacterium]
MPSTFLPADVAAIDITALGKTFRRRDRRTLRSSRRVVALDDITLTVRRGETVAVLGQNGSGKSTLVRVLSTLLLPDRGRASVFGHDVVADAGAVRRLVNRVSVEASFFKKMSAVENLSYAARFHGLTPGATRTAIPDLLNGIGFPRDRRSEPMENLSRGMQQKVALARALLTSPNLLLLDEPTTGLDPRSKQEVQGFIRDMRTRHDVTTLLCTHDLDEAEDLADRVGVLDRGRLIALDAVDALRRRYEAGSLTDVFFAATGRALDDEPDDRKVLA